MNSIRRVVNWSHSFCLWTSSLTAPSAFASQVHQSSGTKDFGGSRYVTVLCSLHSFIGGPYSLLMYNLMALSINFSFPVRESVLFLVIGQGNDQVETTARRFLTEPFRVTARQTIFPHSLLPFSNCSSPSVLAACIRYFFLLKLCLPFRSLAVLSCHNEETLNSRRVFSDQTTHSHSIHHR